MSSTTARGPVIAFVGGGSAKFVSEVVRDIFTYPALAGSRIRLMDVDPERLSRGRRIVEKLINEFQVPATVEATLDRRAAVAGADVVVVTIMVGGFKHYESDARIPMRYGVLPTVGDTIGPGGVFRLVRTAPVLHGLAQDLAELAPDAWVLNYANPMAMNTWTLIAAGHRRTIGLCHSIQGMYRALADWAGVPADEVRFTAAGINHVNFYLSLTHNGRDLYPAVLAAEQAVLEKHPNEKVRFELLRRLGHFPAEGAEHQSEYYGWFRKDQRRADELASETMWGFRFDSEVNQWLRDHVDAQISGEKPICRTRGHEYGSGIVNALVSGEAMSFYGNVRNDDLIDNLPRGSVVEVPCLADANGVFPCRMGRIPTQLAAVMTPHVHVHELAVEGVRRKSRDLIRMAIQADPLTQAVCTLPQIEAMVDDLFVENAAYVGDWPTRRSAVAVGG
ncbi:MAG TPA: alpha-glucosidase/alpha-galactosidase [Planctomycetota bacterium]|nr:alpha-glucosidase/alpha-galactosidase [Planctomycetota bacterium]